MLEVRIRPRAQLDLESIYLHIAVGRSMAQAADDVLDEIYRTIDLVADFPDLGRPYSHEALDRGYRRILAGTFWIFYAREGDLIVVWRVLHTRRDIEDFTLMDL